MDSESGLVEGAYLGVACDVVDGLDEPKQPEHDDDDEREPEREVDALHAHAQRPHDIAERFLLHLGARLILFVGRGRVDDALALKQRLVVDALEHEHAEADEKERLEEVEELHEYQRRHAVVLVVQVDPREKVVQVVEIRAEAASENNRRCKCEQTTFKFST